MNKIHDKYAEGHFISLWIGIGVAVGAGLGVVFALLIGNLAFLGIGIPIGVATRPHFQSIYPARYRDV